MLLTLTAGGCSGEDYEDDDDGDPSSVPGDGTPEPTVAPGDGDGDDTSGAEDADGDGYSSKYDCDDADADVNPGADEICNDVDDNCDGGTDVGGDYYLYYIDADADTYGSELTTVTVKSCDPPLGYSRVKTDCNDQDPEIHPGVGDPVDGIDNDCDWQIDNHTIYTDDDGDGQTEEDGDCNDYSFYVYPGANEIGDGIDNDCDGSIDEDYMDTDDADGDGYSIANGDCNDRDDPGYSGADTYPGAPEICDGDDNDCDSIRDEDCDISIPISTDANLQTEAPDLAETYQRNSIGISSPVKFAAPTASK